MAEFKYQEPFPIENDTTVYRLLTKDYVKTIECEGRKILKIEREGLELLAREAYADVSFYLRAAHLQKLADILKDPEASDNDKFVAHTMLMNQVVSAEGELPTCQDTGTAICIGKKGENVWTGINDAEAISKGDLFFPSQIPESTATFITRSGEMIVVACRGFLDCGQTSFGRSAADDYR